MRYCITIQGVASYVLIKGLTTFTLDPIHETSTKYATRIISVNPVFLHTGLPTGICHTFFQYDDGVILSTHGDNLIPRILNKQEVNAFLKKHGSVTF